MKPLRHSAVAARVLLALFFLVIPAIAPGQVLAQEPIEIAPEDAASHVGELAKVCGTVKSAAYMNASRGQPTFLNFGRPYPNHLFTVVIWGTHRDKFEKPPVRMFDGHHICVTGVVATYKGKPQIIVDDPDQIRLTHPLSTERVLTGLEAIFVKALLEAYGGDVDYGTGEWDQEAVAAMTRFQETLGHNPTGNPDPATLRAMAKQTLDLTDEEQERILRLLLFQLAQRQE